MRTEQTNIFIDAMAMENSLLQAYRNLFLGLEGALLAAWFALVYLLKERGILLLILAIVGLIVGASWIVVCKAKGDDVDKWRKCLLTKTGKNVKRHFSYMESKFSLVGGNIARHWFNTAMPILIIMLWIWLTFILELPDNIVVADAPIIFSQ